MGLFFVYIVKSAVCLAVFYLFYRLLLSRETFHHFNRVALLGILLLSFVLPLIEVTVGRQSGMNQAVLTIEQWLLLMTPVHVEAAPTAAQSPGWMHAALLVYLAGVLFFVGRHLYSLIKLGMFLRTGKRTGITPYYSTSAKVTLIVHDRPIAPFSWMRYIVISQRDLNESGREILAHELAHIRYRHTFDLMVADVAIFFQWFNPAAWLLKQELQNIHEYESDENVIKQGIDAQQYQLLLIKKAVGTRLYSMTNSFNHSKLKKRITMMKREKSNQWARAKYLYVLPLAAVAVTAFARPEISALTDEISAVKVTDLTTMTETKTPETSPVAVKDTLKPRFVPVPVQERQGRKAPDELQAGETMPEFPGGMKAMAQYLTDHVRNTDKTGDGRVVVRCIIGTNGAVTGVQVMRSLNQAADAEAIRVVQTMPKWKPATSNTGEPMPAVYTIPVAFGKQDAAAVEMTGGVSVARRMPAPAPPLELVLYERKTGEPVKDQPLILVNGHEMSHELISAIDPSKIAFIAVRKDEKTLEAYGERGKNGVVEIVLRKDDDEEKEEETDKLLVTPTLTVSSSSRGVLKVNKRRVTTASAGEETFNGMILDKAGKPVIGATVIIEGRSSGAVTDKEGKFSIIGQSGDKLQIRYVGMKTVSVAGAKKMIVILDNE
ncbi:MAG: TonB family protein [Prevotellaceae bacterium]|jgi:TonB family protein|nr:TonB family protein [Prevotellaceae bacterium]